jgi:hypothetical protein
MKYIGGSLSICVADIESGKMALCDVAVIFANTCYGNNAEWESMVSDYRKSLWHRNPDGCTSIASHLRAEGRILQWRKGDNIKMNAPTWRPLGGEAS